MQAALSQQALFAMARCIDNDIKELLVLGEDLGFSCSASSLGDRGSGGGWLWGHVTSLFCYSQEICLINYISFAIWLLPGGNFSLLFSSSPKAWV